MSIIKEGSELRALKFGMTKPFLLILEDAFEVDTILRIIPGRRMVVMGTWKNKRVIAKLFFDKKHVARHSAAEVAGIKLLQERNIPSPTILCQTKNHDSQIVALIFEYLHADIDLMSAWRQHHIRQELMPLLKALVIEIATQHVFGLTQRDLHLNNFVFANNIIYTLDGAQIEAFGDVLPKKQSMQNLALLLSQLGSDADHYQEALFRHYVKARGWIWKDEDLQELFFMIDQWGKERWGKYSKKIFRESTHFHRISSLRNEGVVKREYCQSEFLQFISQPESVFRREDAVMLKNGRSSTVIRINLDGRPLVIKRYNMKNLWHWLRRCIRTTRGKKCWRIAQKLQLFGINTASPVAYIENRLFGLRGKSYFVADYVAGENISDYLQHCPEDKQHQMISNICHLLASLKKMAITHGDLKANNLLVDSNDEPVIIDLDGTQEHYSLVSLQRVSSKEWQRFLRNFDTAPTLKEKFIYATNTK